MDSKISLIDSILKKYINTTSSNNTKKGDHKNDSDIYKDVELPSSEDTNLYSNVCCSVEEVIDLTESKEDDNYNEDIPILDKLDYDKPTSKKKIKVDRSVVKETKQSLKEKEKLLKDCLKTINDNKKPDNCLKLINVLLDNNLKNEDYIGAITQQLSLLSIKYEFVDQIVPYSITWDCTEESLETDVLDRHVIKEKIESSDQLILLLKWNYLVQLVNEQRLKSHVEQLKELCNKSIFLCLYGMENYFKYQKNSVKKYAKIYGNHPKIKRSQLELELTKLQLFCSCSHRFIEKDDDLGLLVAQFSKSIAQIPYKLDKNNKNTNFDWHIATENKDCVYVDKDGNGLQRLWRQQLTTFPGARLETAEAIASLYKTPTVLINKLESVSSESGRDFLKEVPIRRHAGPLNSSRKIGIELSKRVHLFFTSTDGNELL